MVQFATHTGDVCAPQRAKISPKVERNPPPRVKMRKKDDPETAQLQDDKFRRCHIERKEIELSKSTHVAHEISISAHAFEDIVRAIAALSLEQTRFVTFKDVILHAMERYPALKDGHSGALETLLPVDGPVRIYVRLNSTDNAAVERLKGELNAATKAHCGVRETLIFCAMLVAEGEFSACKMQIDKVKL